MLRALIIGSVLVAIGGLLGSRSPASPGVRPCWPRVDFGALPVWAQSGFSPPASPNPHAVGASGRIVAVLFGYPLLSPPPAPPRYNKILWVPRRQTSRADLSIRAQRMSGTEPIGSPVERIVHGGPGPSHINLPAAGCWRLSLRWSGGSDTVDLRYRRSG